VIQFNVEHIASYRVTGLLLALCQIARVVSGSYPVQIPNGPADIKIKLSLSCSVPTPKSWDSALNWQPQLSCPAYILHFTYHQQFRNYRFQQRNGVVEQAAGVVLSTSSHNRTANLAQFSRFKVPTAAGMDMIALWNIALCGLVEVDRRFRGAYCLHHRPDDGGSSNP
jgi:hypothetical protein